MFQLYCELQQSLKDQENVNRVQMQNERTVLMFCDVEKAFDRVQWDFFFFEAVLAIWNLSQISGSGCG